MAKLKKNGRAGRSAVTLRDAVKTPKEAAESAQLPESYTDRVRRGGGRTRLAEDAGKLFEAIRRFAEKHKLSRSLQRRLDNCTDALWDLEMEEDAKSGALDRAFGEMAERARRDYKAGSTLSLEEALELMKERRDGKVIPFEEALKIAKSRR
ncbi:MAG: hypothetical protein ACR2QC_11160 [Gammaproteobacteria bacterium]